MSSLTESSLTYNSYLINNNDNNKIWYKYAYLCIEKEQDKNDNKIVNGFTCYQFYSLLHAHNYYQLQKNKSKELFETKYAIVPVCKYIPLLFHPFVLNYKLKKLLWKNNINIMRIKDLK
jgi:hypothetical protein